MSAAGTRVQIERRTRRGWVPGAGELRRWADAALGRAAAGCEISVLLVGPQRSRTLNARYRGRDHATNVLSFPAMAMAVAGAGAPVTPGGRHAAAAARGTARPPAAARTGIGAPPRRVQAPAPRLLGDLVICPAVLRREARAQRKSERAHWAHLVVHGVLHLVGFDHEDDADARRMERREVRVLHGLGIANPYRSA